MLAIVFFQFALRLFFCQPAFDERYLVLSAVIFVRVTGMPLMDRRAFRVLLFRVFPRMDTRGGGNYLRFQFRFLGAYADGISGVIARVFLRGGHRANLFLHQVINDTQRFFPEDSRT